MRSLYLVTLLSLLLALLLGSCGDIDLDPESNSGKTADVKRETGVTDTVSADTVNSDNGRTRSDPTVPPHLSLALSYAGTQEVGNNGGPEVTAFLAAVDLPPGNPYCAAFISYILDEAGPTEDGRMQSVPTVRSGLAYHFITDESIPARKVLRGTVAIPPGTIHVMRKGDTIYGHAGFVEEQMETNRFATIEANTSPGPEGSQRDGQGIWERVRSIQPGNYFRITDFTLVHYG